MLALARAFRAHKPARTLRFAAFVNEEPPFFHTDEMGSLVYAKACRSRSEKVVAMLSLETMGCFSEAEGSQSYPLPFSLFYPSRGNFIAFVGNLESRSLVHRAIACFREHARFPSEGGAVPGFIQGVGWSDHWSFWKAGYPAIMITDTAPLRTRTTTSPPTRRIGSTTRAWRGSRPGSRRSWRTSRAAAIDGEASPRLHEDFTAQAYCRQRQPTYPSKGKHDAKGPF